MQRFLQYHGRVEQHAYRDEEEDREGVLQRERVFGSPCTELRLAKNHTREEGPQGERHPKNRRGAVGNTDGGCDDAQREQFAGAGLGHLPKQPRE